LFAFFLLWREEVRIMYATGGKSFLLIKDVEMLDLGAYSDFIAVLVALRKRM
jgi:hypothetical protein